MKIDVSDIVFQSLGVNEPVVKHLVQGEALGSILNWHAIMNLSPHVVERAQTFKILTVTFSGGSDPL